MPRAMASRILLKGRGLPLAQRLSNPDGGTLLPARYLQGPLSMQSRGYLGGGHRNGDPYYDIPKLKLNAHFFEGPLRVSSLRSLGAFANIVALESFMDMLAERAGTDPLAFRLAHLSDKRAIAVLEKVGEMTATETVAASEGVGYAFMRYKNTEAYVSVAAKVAVDKNRGQLQLLHLWAAVDVGEVINPDGIRNQLEGGMLQAASWILKEEVTFDESTITSVDWQWYPIFRFQDVPQMDVMVMDRSEEPAVGAGEPVLPPTGAAIANAVYHACGVRVYAFPISAEKLRS